MNREKLEEIRNKLDGLLGLLKKKRTLVNKLVSNQYRRSQILLNEKLVEATSKIIRGEINFLDYCLANKGIYFLLWSFQSFNRLEETEKQAYGFKKKLVEDCFLLEKSSLSKLIELADKMSEKKWRHFIMNGGLNLLKEISYLDLEE